MDDKTDEFFCDLMELSPGERMTALAEMSGLSEEQKQHIRLMLEEAERAEDYFTGTSVAVKMVPFATKAEGAGEMCGPYKLIRKLGEGGFGLVWLAEQEKPLKRTVAVKILKAGMDSAEVLARFDAEKQALARMDHPNIAKVLDAGMTESGRSYFAMELVEGCSVTQFCEENALSTHDRLKLFMDVCAAVGHAHQKGVIHRDLKPTNVLVSHDDTGAIVKVIDFGIAKAIEGDLTDQTLLTRAEQWIGTPIYMSPEQLGMGSADLDTRSDIYALGVILYELITGCPPFDSQTLMRAGYEEMRRIIREDDPPRPSARITTLQNSPTDSPNKGSATTSNALKSIKSELDWIVMKAMDKAKERRYETAAALADEVSRFLADEPVSAKPPSAIYTLGKFAKRHRGLLQVVSVIAIMLIGATAFSSYQAIRASKAEKLAEQRMTEALSERNAKTKALNNAEAVSRFLSDAFTRPTPEADGRKITMVEALDAATAKLEKDLTNQPLLKVDLLNVLADTYEKLGILPKSLDLRRKALRILKSQGDQAMNDTLETSSLLVAQLSHLGHYEEARDLGLEELKLRKKHNGLTNSETLSTLESLALNTFRSGEYLKAIDLQEKLFRNLSSSTPSDDPRLPDALETLLIFCEDSDNSDKAQHYTTEFAEAMEKPDTTTTKKAPSVTKENELLQKKKTLDELEKKLGKLNTRTIEARSEVSDALASLSRFEEAIEYQDEVVLAAKEVYGEAHQKTLREIEKLLYFNNAVARWDVSMRLRREATQIRNGALGANYYDTLCFQGELIFSKSLIKKPLEGLAIGKEYIPKIRRVMGPTSREYYHYSCQVARCLASAGKTQDAIKVLAECCPNMPDDTYLNHMLASFRLWNDKMKEYEDTRELMIGYQKKKRDRFKNNCEILDRNVLVCCLAPFKNEEQANEIAMSLKQSESATSSPKYRPRLHHGFAWSRTINGVAYYRLGKPQKALECFDEALRHAEANPETDGDAKWELDMIAMYRPMALYAMGKTTEAKLMFSENAKTIDHPEDPSEPHKGLTSPLASEMAILLAHREAVAILGLKTQE